MEGLEINEIYFNALERTRRLDAEFYKKQNITILNKIKQFEPLNLTEYVSVSDGNHMSISDSFIEKGIPYYRGQDIHHYFIENASPICIDENNFNSPYMLRSHLKKGDILLSIVGTIGKLSLVYSELKATCSCKLAILRPKNKFSSELISVYLSSNYGQNQIKKFTRGAVQMGLILEDMDQIFIPKFSDNFDMHIVKLVQSAHSVLSLSNEAYRNAESSLLNELNLLKCIPNKNSQNTKSLKESFLSTGRLDAEYYQPKYENYHNIITYYKNGFTFIRNEFEHIIYTSTKKEAGYYYIEIGDVSISDGSCQANYIETESLPANAKTIAAKGDILISNVRPNRGAVSIINMDCNNLIVSGAFTVLRTKENSQYSNELLKVLLRLPMYRDWLLQFNIGTQYPVIKDEDILNLPIPLFSNDIQNEVTIKIRKSEKLKKQSEQLLEIAKTAVEIAIEQNEAIAMEYINSFHQLQLDDEN